MYSVGLPLLYPITFIYFVIDYWANKILLMRYYQKTNQFNEELPINSKSLLFLSVFLHLVLLRVVMDTSNIFQPSNIGEENLKTYKDIHEVKLEKNTPIYIVIINVYMWLLGIILFVDNFIFCFTDIFFMKIVRIITK